MPCVNSTDPQLVRQEGSWRFIYVVQDSTGLCLGRGGFHCCWVGTHKNQKPNSRYLDFLGIRDQGISRMSGPKAEKGEEIVGHYTS